MPEFSGEFWIMLVTYGVSFGVIYGSIKTRLVNLEKKMDKHNNLVERMAIAEREFKAVWRNIDEMKEEIKHEHQLESPAQKQGVLDLAHSGGAASRADHRGGVWFHARPERNGQPTA